jgi:hypothetical protein
VVRLGSKDLARSMRERRRQAWADVGLLGDEMCETQVPKEGSWVNRDDVT